MKKAEPCMGCWRSEHAQRKMERLEELMREWARCDDEALAKAAAKVARLLTEVTS